MFRAPIHRACYGHVTNSIRYRVDELKYHDQLRYNLSYPTQSPLLRAPLSESAGGWEICVKRDAEQTAEAVFTTVEDPDYRAILASVQSGKDA